MMYAIERAARLVVIVMLIAFALFVVAEGYLQASAIATSNAIALLAVKTRSIEAGRPRPR